jgi:lipopolysaccharide/colanic/teichoic acid biosynthesis glycosyltransferase
MVKRLFDVLVSLTALLLVFPVILILFILASFDTGLSGLFVQHRIGRHGKIFSILKVRTMDADSKVSAFGRFLRKTKTDELPQLLNVLMGDMSLVGPRPDVPGYYDRLQGEERKLLQLRPGLTGQASLKYRNEDALLAQQPNPEKYNDEIIFPDKVRINMQYLHNQSFWLDLKILVLTATGGKIND